MNIDVHADDFGLTLNTSKDILDCMENGCLDSISIISNTRDFEKSMDLLYNRIPFLPFLPLMSVHVTLTEGECSSRNLPKSWSNHFFNSYWLNRKKIKEDIKKEIKKQIDITNEVINKCIDIAKANSIPCKQKSIRIDSHTHSHLVPIIWESLMEVIEENNYEVEYIRNAKEPIVPFLKKRNLIQTYRPINIIKNMVLMMYSGKVDRYCETHNMRKMYMWGLIMSGKMNIERIKELYPELLEYSIKHNRDLEILFHPGSMINEELNDDILLENYTNFYSSNGRNIEKSAVLKIKDIVSNYGQE